MFVPIGSVSHTFLVHETVVTQECWWSESYVYQSLNFHVNYEVAPVVGPILSVGMLTRKRDLIVIIHSIA